MGGGIMIELKHISKWYNVGGKPTFILKDINLKINEGEFVSIKYYRHEGYAFRGVLPFPGPVGV